MYGRGKVDRTGFQLGGTVGTQKTQTQSYYSSKDPGLMVAQNSTHPRPGAPQELCNAETLHNSISRIREDMLR